MAILGNVLFFIFLIICLIVLFFGLPGTFMILGAAVLYGFLTGFAKITGSMLLLMLLFTIIGEVAEYIFGVIGAKRYGSSTKGIVFSIVGGFFGAILGAPLFFGLGAIIGALCGAFIGAVLVELYTYGLEEWKQALRSGWGNFLGRMAGMFFKIGIAIGMIVWIAVTVI